MGYQDCKWIESNGTRCNLPRQKDKDFCYKHLPSAYAGHPHGTAPDEPEPKLAPRPLVGNTADATYRAVPRMTTEERNKHWKEGMAKHNKPKKEKSKGRFRSTLWVEADFPRNIDGIFFQCLAEYEDFVYGQYESSKTNPDNYDEFTEITASDKTKKWLNQSKSVSQARQDNWDMTDEDWDAYLAQSGGRYSTSAYSGSYKSSGSYYSEKNLKIREIAHQDTILHMHYYIARGKDGLYYSVWVSCPDKEKLTKEVLDQIVESMPCSVTQIGDVRYHTSQGYGKYSDADSRFSCGGESFWNIRTRIDRAKDPNWIPPNIRKMAFEGIWDEIPAEYKEKARKWFDQGCPGWWGTWHSRKEITRSKVTSGKGLSVRKHTPPLGKPQPKLLKPASQTEFEAVRQEMKEFLDSHTGLTPIVPTAQQIGFTSHRPLITDTASHATPTIGCRMRKYDGTVCGKPVNHPPYCSQHNIHLFGYPTGRNSLQ